MTDLETRRPYEMGMVERVARAICLANTRGTDHFIDVVWRQYEPQARAAIAEMRQPTRMMLGAAWPSKLTCAEVRQTYQEMIGEAMR